MSCPAGWPRRCASGWTGSAGFQRADALAALGRMGEATGKLREGLERGQRARRTWMIGGWVPMAAHLHFMAGALSDARANAEAHESLESAPISHVAGSAAMLARFRVALHTGDSMQLRRSLRSARRVPHEAGPAVIAAVAAQARGLVTGDPSELVRAADLLDGSERPLLHASALADAGRSLGDVHRLGYALDLYTTAGAGATNRDAAERLYLSPHTVSTHLRHAFAKLQINSRVELARMLLEHDAPALAG